MKERRHLMEQQKGVIEMEKDMNLMHKSICKKSRNLSMLLRYTNTLYYGITLYSAESQKYLSKWKSVKNVYKLKSILVENLIHTLLCLYFSVAECRPQISR